MACRSLFESGTALWLTWGEKISVIIWLNSGCENKSWSTIQSLNKCKNRFNVTVPNSACGPTSSTVSLCKDFFCVDRVFVLAWSYRVPSSEKCRPAGSAEVRCSDVVGQLHPFLCQLVNIGGPANRNTRAVTGQFQQSEESVRLSKGLF